MKCECGETLVTIYAHGTRILWCRNCGRREELPYPEEREQEAERYELAREAEWLGLND